MIDYFEIAKSITQAYKMALDLEDLNRQMILSRIKQAPESLKRPVCKECGQPLNDDEIRGAEQERIKEPICDDCFSDWLNAKQ